MKILQVIPNLLKGGAQRLVIDICNELFNHNVECVLLVLTHSKNEFHHISKNINIVYINVTFKLSIFKKSNIDIEDYEKVVNSFNPDVIHSHLYFSELICHESPRKNITYVTHFHDNIEQLSNLKLINVFSKKLMIHFYEKQRLLRKFKQTKKVYITISNDCDYYAKSIFPKNLANKVIKLENAINHSMFINPNIKKVNKSQISIINVGNLLKKKNQIFIIDIVKYLISMGYDTQLKLVGEGSCRKEIVNYAKSMQIDKHINMVGAVDNVQNLLWESDFYVHSAKYEPFGLVLIEAMASKIPIISFNGKGNQDIIIDNETGFLINNLNAKAFGDTLIKLFNDKTLYDNIVEKAYVFSKKYDIKEYSLKLLNIYEQEC
jgi:glycosyltransferase involved in cell wall biosynthesis